MLILVLFPIRMRKNLLHSMLETATPKESALVSVKMYSIDPSLSVTPGSDLSDPDSPASLILSYVQHNNLLMNMVLILLMLSFFQENLHFPSKQGSDHILNPCSDHVQTQPPTFGGKSIGQSFRDPGATRTASADTTNMYKREGACYVDPHRLSGGLALCLGDDLNGSRHTNRLTEPCNASGK